MNANSRLKTWQRHKKSMIKKGILVVADKCEICGSSHDMTVDHIVPMSKGGTDDPSNLRTLCRICNCKKGNR